MTRRRALPPIPARVEDVFTAPPPPSPLVPGVASRREENQLRQLKAAMRLFGVPREWFAPEIAAKLDTFPNE